MNKHPYLRAYMAGVLLPTWFLLVILTAWILARLVYEIHIPIERAVVFPMAIVPNLWGLWNLIYVASELRRRGVPSGLFGAVLPLLLLPGGMLAAQLLDVDLQLRWIAMIAPPIMLLYYLLWQHVVPFFNRVVGLDA